MEFLDYITGQGGLVILGFIVAVVFFYRKYKEKRYFKSIKKRIDERKKND